MSIGNKGAFEEFMRGLTSPEEQEQSVEESKAIRKKQIEDAGIYFDVFSTGRGVELLEILKDRTTRASTMRVAGAIVDGDINMTAGEFMSGREMQNALIRFIESQIVLAQQSIDGE